MVFRKGELVLRDGVILRDSPKSVFVSEFTGKREAIAWGLDRRNRERWEKQYGYSPWVTAIDPDEFAESGAQIEAAGWFQG